jgi:hypothetical protein
MRSPALVMLGAIAATSRLSATAFYDARLFYLS